MIEVQKIGKMFPFMDGQEYGQSKEGRKEMEMKEGQEPGIELKAQENGIHCDTFPLLKEYTESFFLLFS